MDREAKSKSLGIKQVITPDGVWRIKRRDKSPIIEVYKYKELGYGDIVSQEFIAWRNRLVP